MTDNPYSPDKPCQRGDCIVALRRDRRYRLVEMIRNDVPHERLEQQRQLIRDTVTGDHLGGAHLDPRDREHYDGLRTSYNAAPLAVRNATYALMIRAHAFVERPADHDSPLRRDVEVALDACFQEIDRLRQQVAHVQVDADNKIREASRRALDCDAHGQAIADLEKQVAHFEAALDRTEKARLALLGEHEAVRELIDGYARMAAAGPVSVEFLQQMIESLRKANTKTSAAHNRVWNGTS